MLYAKVVGEGKPLYVIHGFLGMSDNWKTLGSQFSKNGYQVHLLDMRNHGRSFRSDVHTYEAMVKDVVEYAASLQHDSIDVIGHSMGGKVAMFLAVNNPGLVSKVVIADIGVRYYAPHHQTILEGLQAVDFSVKPSRQQVEDILEKYIHDFGTRQFLLKNLYWEQEGQLGFRFNLPSLVKNVENIGQALQEGTYFQGPSLFVRGANSGYVKDEDLENIHSHFPNMLLKTIPDASHWLHAEKPREFYSIVVEFLLGSN